MGGLLFSAAFAVFLSLARVSIDERADRRTDVEDKVSLSPSFLLLAGKGATCWYGLTSSGLVGGRTGGLLFSMSWMALAVRVVAFGGLVLTGSAVGAARFKGDPEAPAMVEDEEAAMSFASMLLWRACFSYVGSNWTVWPAIDERLCAGEPESAAAAVRRRFASSRPAARSDASCIIVSSSFRACLARLGSVLDLGTKPCPCEPAIVAAREALDMTGLLRWSDRPLMPGPK